MSGEKRTSLLSSVFLVLISFSFVAMAIVSKYTAYYLCFFVAFVPSLSNLCLVIKGCIPSDEETDDKKSARILKSLAKPVTIILLLLIIASAVVFFILKFGSVGTYSLSFVYPTALAFIVIVCIVLELWCQHSSGEDTYYSAILKNLRSSFSIVRITSVVILVSNVFLLLNIYDFTIVLKIVIAVFFSYEIVMMLISLVIDILKKEVFEKPDLTIPKPIAIGKSKDLSLITYLENNTGLTMRSLWSIVFIKNAIPYAIVAMCLVFWFCTGITQVESYQRGVVYRFGSYRTELSPGLHLTLPWPLEKVELYDTDVIREMTIGYVSDGNTDNLWTTKTGTNEYKLLLGGGNELVSLNLKINYRIKDVKEYALSSSSPSEIVQASAYNAITKTIISTDIDTLLDTDRVAFSERFAQQLTSGIEKYNTGIELVSVVLESIHPPFEIAEVFQNLVGAEITAAKYIYEAHGLAEVTLADANKRYDSAVNLAISDQYDKIARAKSDVAKFMASVEADTNDSSAYRYYKYLKALETAYGKSTLVIISDGIDSSNIYFGTIWNN